MQRVKSQKGKAKRLIVNIITFKWLCFGLIKFYKAVLSRFMGRGCIYTPTCSTYTYSAIEEFGTLKGIALGTKRILRCNQFASGGYDPVPENPRGDMKWLF